MRPMKVKDIMTGNPVCCTPHTSLRDVARMMADSRCGEVPVVDNEQNKKVVGVITDRDICVRGVALEKDPATTEANFCMTSSVTCVSENMDAKECCRVMEENKVRRVPVIDGSGKCVGIVSLTDIANKLSDEEAGEVLHRVTKKPEKAEWPESPM